MLTRVTHNEMKVAPSLTPEFTKRIYLSDLKGYDINLGRWLFLVLSPTYISLDGHP